MRAIAHIAAGSIVLLIGLVAILALTNAAGPSIAYTFAIGALALGLVLAVRGFLLFSGQREEARVTLSRPSRLIKGEILDSDYPAEALDAGIEGQVELGFLVGEAGDVQHVEVTRSSGSEILDKASEAILLQRYAYEPALNTLGESIAHYRTYAVDWVLRTGEAAEEPCEPDLTEADPDCSVPVSTPEVDLPSTSPADGNGEGEEFAVDADGLNRWDRKWLERDLAKPWSELIWSIRQCDPREPFGLVLLQRAYEHWGNDTSLDVNELDECRVRLAQALATVGRDAEALGLLRVALAGRERGNVTKGEPVSLILLRIAEIEAKVGAAANAIDTARRALAAQPQRHFFYNDRARGYGLLAKLLSEAGDAVEARIAGDMAAAWTKLATASAMTMRDAPEAGLANAQAARRMMIAAVGNMHGDLRFADRAISEAAADIGP